MIRINLLPHREEKRKRRQQQFGVLAGLAAAIGLVVAGAVWFFLDQQAEDRRDAREHAELLLAALALLFAVGE